MQALETSPLRIADGTVGSPAGVAATSNVTNAAPLQSKATLPFGHPSPTAKYPEHPGFTLWLVEEFDEPLDLSSDPIWTWSDGGLSEGQARFVKEQIKFRDGKMILELARNNGQVKTQACSHAEKGFIDHKAFLSGEIRTQSNLFRYGRYEVRMKAPSVQPGNPNAKGNYVSTMFVFRDSKFQSWREIDFELTGEAPGSVWTNVLSADNNPHWNKHMDHSIHHDHLATLNVRSDFHTFAFEWLPDRITWYLDGAKIREMKSSDMPMPPIPDKSMKVIMNLWLAAGSSKFGGAHIENNVYPMHSEYDWFRFYRWNGDKQYPCSDMSTSCLYSPDRHMDSNNPCDGKSQQAACQASC
jgi:beta-glucanase (GH16 family)